MKIKMLKGVATKVSFYPEGAVVQVPFDITEDRAKAWVKAGLAEEYKMIDRAPETKEALTPPTDIGGGGPGFGTSEKLSWRKKKNSGKK